MHSIWGLVNDLAARVEVASRIVEWRPLERPDAGVFPPLSGAGDAPWEAALDDLDGRHRSLLDVVAGLDGATLEASVPGIEYSVAVMLHGTVHHYAYYAV